MTVLIVFSYFFPDSIRDAVHSDILSNKVFESYILEWLSIKCLYPTYKKVMHLSELTNSLIFSTSRNHFEAYAVN